MATDTGPTTWPHVAEEAPALDNAFPAVITQKANVMKRRYGVTPKGRRPLDCGGGNAEPRASADQDGAAIPGGVAGEVIDSP